MVSAEGYAVICLDGLEHVRHAGRAGIPFADVVHELREGDAAVAWLLVCPGEAGLGKGDGWRKQYQE